MTRHTPTTRPTDSSRHTQADGASPRDRGSLLILCVTVLVIIALIGIAYLQRVRMDQFATARHERSYINLVINGILGEVSNQMEADVEENITAGNLLYDYPWTDHVEQTFEATQEYPTPVIRLVNGYKQNDPGAKTPKDDRWLASTAPVWDATLGVYRWLHLTNLTGIWLHLPDPLGGGGAVIEHLINGDESQIGDARRSDTNLALSNSLLDGLAFAPPGYETRGTDADGDGIIDSAWQWTPISVRRLGGNKYVMALRIVDLNSMLNVNTATSLTYNGDPGTPIAARGFNPCWVDLSRLMSRMPTAYISTGEWRDELTELVRLRITPTNVPANDFNVGGAIIFDTTRLGRIVWEEQGSIYGNTDRNFLMDSEMELRRFGGLNDRALTSTLESRMGQIYPAGSQSSRALRQHPALSDDTGVIGAEGSYLDVVGTGLTLNQAVTRWFYGDNGTPISNSGDQRVRDREFPAIRHMLTAASGAGIYAPVPPAPTLASSRIKYKLNRDWDGIPPDVDQDMRDLTDQIEAAFKSAGGNYLGLTDPEIDVLIDEYVVAIKDYSDPDTVPSIHPDNPGVYGMERLPFLREVYVQALYVDVVGDTSDRAPWDPANDGSVGSNYVGWSPAQSDVGGETYALAIELGNPFNHLIYGLDPRPADSHTEGLNGQVEIRVYQGGTTLGTWRFDPANTPDGTIPDIGPRDESSNDDTLIIYSPPRDKIPDAAGIDGNDLPGDLNFPADAQTLQLNDGELTNGFTPGGAPIEVELWVETPNGPRMYDRIELDAGASLPLNVDRPSPVAATGSPENLFAQASSARDSELINYVVDDGPGSTDLRTNLPNPSGSYDPTNTDRFGDDMKGNSITQAADPNFYNRLQLQLPDEPMVSIAELGLVHMLSFTDFDTFSERMSANFVPSIAENRHFLHIDPRKPGYTVRQGTPTSHGIPHAALLLDMVTTVSPESDGIDNDNADGDNDLQTPVADTAGEIFVPGLINVNTAPMHLMTLGAPLGETLDEAEKLMRTIVAYRDEPLRGNRIAMGQNHGQYWNAGAAGFDVRNIRDPLTPQHLTGFTTNRLDEPGIASLGELLYLNPGGNPENDMMTYGLDNAAGLPGGTDMHPDPDISATNARSQDVLDDNEELLARFGMLSQAYTVRSDRFVVYGVVRGYDNKDLNNLPVETARFIAVIDRGNMVTTGDSPRVIGFVRLQ